uniref:ZF-HD dimerization-type domain-containing protein n=1 Tax=Kalanchoe fedtschenkoi TaxID=63787 RepID=A0A7N0TXQ5_KALFE
MEQYQQQQQQQHNQIKLSQHHTTTPSPPRNLPPPPPLAYPPSSIEQPPRTHTSLHDRDPEVEDKKNGVLFLSAPSAGMYGGGGGELQSPESLKLSPVGTRSKPVKSASPSGVRYRECLKNHAASMGTNVVDGCGEFMPGGKEGSLEALKCAACQCHRNFHRRELEGHESGSSNFARSVIVHPLHLPPPTQIPLHHHHPHHHHHHQIVQPVAVAYGGGATESSSEDLVQALDEMPQREAEPGSVRKRFRTKFTQEQKDKMLGFAERLGWRLQRQDDEVVERFCSEVGVRRQVLKVWMHNNKNSFKKPPDEDQQQQTHNHPPTTHPQIQLQPQHHHLLQLHQQKQQETL